MEKKKAKGEKSFRNLFCVGLAQKNVQRGFCACPCINRKKLKLYLIGTENGQVQPSTKLSKLVIHVKPLASCGSVRHQSLWITLANWTARIHYCRST